MPITDLKNFRREKVTARLKDRENFGISKVSQWVGKRTCQAGTGEEIPGREPFEELHNLGKKS